MAHAFLDYNSDTDISLNETNSSQGHTSICKKLLNCRMWTNFLKLRGDLVELQKNMTIASHSQNTTNTTTFAGISNNQSSCQQKQQSLGNQKQITLSQDELDTLYVGNLSEDINKCDLFELFGRRTTNYLRDNSDIQIPFSENTRKKRSFEYVKMPRHVSDELLKLHGIGFKGKTLVIEKAKTPPKAKNINGGNQSICS